MTELADQMTEQAGWFDSHRNRFAFYKGIAEALDAIDRSLGTKKEGEFWASHDLSLPRRKKVLEAANQFIKAIDEVFAPSVPAPEDAQLRTIQSAPSDQPVVEEMERSYQRTQECHPDTPEAQAGPAGNHLSESKEHPVDQAFELLQEIIRSALSGGNKPYPGHAVGNMDLPEDGKTTEPDRPPVLSFRSVSCTACSSTD